MKCPADIDPRIIRYMLAGTAALALLGLPPAVTRFALSIAFVWALYGILDRLWAIRWAIKLYGRSGTRSQNASVYFQVQPDQVDFLKKLLDQEEPILKVDFKTRPVAPSYMPISDEELGLEVVKGALYILNNNLLDTRQVHYCLSDPEEAQDG